MLINNFTFEHLLTDWFLTSPLLPAQGNYITELLEIRGQFGNFMIKLRNKITKPEETAG